MGAKIGIVSHFRFKSSKRNFIDRYHALWDVILEKLENFWSFLILGEVKYNDTNPFPPPAPRNYLEMSLMGLMFNQKNF